ncbi:MAG: permease-like cell division protein FtsX [Cytophagales bacterium]|nr:permease-like cell division protein FtsX [Cytophagales bacterium]
MGRKLRKKKLGSFPFLGSTMTMALALFLAGLFCFLLLLARNLDGYLRDNIEIQVFLDRQLGDAEISRIGRVLSSRDFVARSEGAVALRFLSREDATAQFIRDTGEDFMRYLDDTPLRDVFFIGIDELYQSPEHFRQIKRKLEGMSGVYEVVYVESLIESLYKNLGRVGFLLVSVSCLLFLSSTLLIHHVIRLSVFSQRFLIRSMQLVGATHSFVRRPFLLRALLYGFLAGLCAMGLIYGFIRVGDNYVEGLESLHGFEDILILGGFLLLIGPFLAYFSTYLAVHRYLRLSLDELY